MEETVFASHVGEFIFQKSFARQDVKQALLHGCGAKDDNFSIVG